MNNKKLWLIPAILITIILVIVLAVVLFFQLRVGVEAPVIELEVYDGPDYSESDNMCYYRVEAIASGNPDPEITFSDDDNVRQLDSDRIEVAIEAGKSYELTAIATNSKGTATATITLKGEYGEEVAEEEEGIAEEIAVEETTESVDEEPVTEPEPEPATEPEPEPATEPETEPEPAAELEPEPPVASENLRAFAADRPISGYVNEYGVVMDGLGVIYVGDTAGTPAAQNRGFLSFDVSSIAGENITNAWLTLRGTRVGNPESLMRELAVTSFDYGNSLNGGDYGGSGSTLTSFFPLNHNDFSFTNDQLKDAVQTALTSGRQYFQVKIYINSTSGNDSKDGFEFYLSNIGLEVSYN